MSDKKHIETIATHAGLKPGDNHGIVNPPVYHVSTILMPNYADYQKARAGQYGKPTYGRYGSPTTEALSEAVSALLDADHTFLTNTGVSSYTTALMAFLSAGDHLLMADTTYDPTRRFLDHELSRFGVEVTYYDPSIGAGIAKLMKSNTKVIYVESPGSLTFEVQDIPAIAEAAHAKGAVVMSDITYAGCILMKPFELGIDIAIQSLTKYVSGHSDLIMGAISVKDVHKTKLMRVWKNLGSCPAPDDCFLALRGLRTLPVRLKQHEASALQIAQWIAEQPGVQTVLHPALPSCPGHDLWKRDFSGSNGLFAFTLEKHGEERLAAFLDGLELFGMGYSWGGYESLLIPFDLTGIRTATQWNRDVYYLRMHVGLEYPDDLIADLAKGLERYRSS